MSTLGRQVVAGGQAKGPQQVRGLAGCRESCDKNHQKALCVATLMPSCASPVGQAAPHVLVWIQMDRIECERAYCVRKAQPGHSWLWFDLACYKQATVACARLAFSWQLASARALMQA